GHGRASLAPFPFAAAARSVLLRLLPSRRSSRGSCVIASWPPSHLLLPLPVLAKQRLIGLPKPSERGARSGGVSHPFARVLSFAMRVESPLKSSPPQQQRGLSRPCAPACRRAAGRTGGRGRHAEWPASAQGAAGPAAGHAGAGGAGGTAHKGRCRVGREVAHPGPSPDPDKEISTIRLFHRCDSWLPTPDPDHDPWAGKRHLSKEIRKPLPRETLALAATAQPLVPGPLRRFDESQETPKVTTHAEVVAVASQTSTERGVLCLNRLMPMASPPVVEGLRGPSQARPPSLAPHPPVTFTGTCPIQRAPQKVKGGWTFATLLRLGRMP